MKSRYAPARLSFDVHFKMKYPDGKAIQVGDLIWWNEGVCLGFVQWIWDVTTDGDYSWANTDGPPLFIFNRHPYNETNGPAGVIHDEPCLADEGVGLLSDDDQEEFQLATELAKRRSKLEFEGRIYAVQTRAEACQRVQWVFSIFEDETCIEMIVIDRGELNTISDQAAPSNGG